MEARGVMALSNPDLVDHALAQGARVACLGRDTPKARRSVLGPGPPARGEDDRQTSTFAALVRISALRTASSLGVIFP